MGDNSDAKKNASVIFQQLRDEMKETDLKRDGQIDDIKSMLGDILIQLAEIESISSKSLSSLSISKRSKSTNSKNSTNTKIKFSNASMWIKYKIKQDHKSIIDKYMSHLDDINSINEHIDNIVAEFGSTTNAGSGKISSFIMNIFKKNNLMEKIQEDFEAEIE